MLISRIRIVKEDDANAGAILKRMTAHETAAIAFLTKEIAGDADATLPLIAFLCYTEEAT